MNDIVIRAEGLGKKYLIGHEHAARDGMLRDAMMRAVKGLARSTRDMLHGRQTIAGDSVEEFWALKDVNFEIRRGEVVGVIGRNGAGKSTLLKVLSRITEPTTGRIEIKGRVASLLEVGTGFHPELTGRENIYLNGAILGMTQAEIRRKFDEIVAFAEVEKFLDTPVKRYSSGMYVRLAFAVAAHLEPEILIVDEVLAVGDAEFQKKCLGKMQDVAGHGRTVLFVSHNMAALSRTCQHGVIFDAGRLMFRGTIEESLRHYMDAAANVSGSANILSGRKRPKGRDPEIIDFQCLTPNAVQGGRIAFQLTLEVSLPKRGVVLGVGFCDPSGGRILSVDSDYAGNAAYEFIKAGIYKIEFTLPSLLLAAATYSLDIGCRLEGGQMLDEVRSAISLTILPSSETTSVQSSGYRTALARAVWADAVEI